MTFPRSLRPPGPRRLVSGGQTGVDRAALDVALALEIPCGGWCPRGRLAEDGRIDLRYPLQETDGADTAQRTRLNVMESDASLVITLGSARGGSALTIAEADRHRKPCLVLDLLVREAPVTEVLDWLTLVRPVQLNIAGSRESEAPGIYRRTRALLELVWRELGSVAETGE
jgi:hypothetical protein